MMRLPPSKRIGDAGLRGNRGRPPELVPGARGGKRIVAREHLERAVRLSPLDPQRPGMLAAIAAAHFAAGRFDAASSLATKAMLEQSNNFIAALVAAASNALAGNLDAAQRATELVRASDPNFRIQNVKYRLPHRQPEVLTRWEDALRKAGMPE